MKRVSLAFFLAILFLVVPGCGGSSGGAEDNPQLTAMVEAQWGKYLATLPAQAGGLALYVMTPEGRYFASTGIENASENIHFRAASNTKSFTAASIMLLAQDGKLKIDDHITDLIPGTNQPYVPDSADYAIPYKGQITIRQLLRHRAGVFDVTNNEVPQSCNVPYAGQNYIVYQREVLGHPDHQYSFDELVGIDALCQLSSFVPGEGYSYSNTGYSILGKIIERVSGISYAEFVEKRLIAPNGLSDTSVPVLATDTTIPAPFAAGNVIENGQLIAWTEDNMSANIAEGNIISTPSDLGRWVRRLLRGEAGPNSESVQEMIACLPGENPCYGFGLFEVADLGPSYGHNGAHAGYLSLMLHDPARDVTIVIFSSLLNFDDAAAEMAVQKEVAKQARQILGYSS